MKMKIRDFTSDGELKFTGKFEQYAETWQHVRYTVLCGLLKLTIVDRSGFSFTGPTFTMH